MIDTSNWEIERDIMIPRGAGKALRSLADPPRFRQPDHMRGYVVTDQDNGGVHANSGIPNKVFYLVAMDIGTDKAALIWYDTLQKLPPDAIFQTFAVYLTDSARLLTNNGQVPIGTTQTVRIALKEVGLFPIV